jgi:hypothetical protein
MRWAIISDPFLGNDMINTGKYVSAGNGYTCNGVKWVLSTRLRTGDAQRELGQPSQLTAGTQYCTGLEHGSRGIAIVNIRYQETSSENSHC